MFFVLNMFFVCREYASSSNPSLTPLVLTLCSLLLRPVRPFQDVRYENIVLALALISAPLPFIMFKSVFGVDKYI